MKQKKNIQEVMQKDNPEFASEVASLSVEHLDARLAQLAKDAQASEEAKEADEELTAAKAQSIDLGAPYRDVKKAIKLKSEYIISLIKEKGGKV